MDKCYQGIAIPSPIEEPCGNSYMSTNCVNTPEQIIYLGLPAGTSQTVINSNLVAALQTANQLIQDLTARIEILENT